MGKGRKDYTKVQILRNPPLWNNGKELDDGFEYSIAEGEDIDDASVSVRHKAKRKKKHSNKMNKNKTGIYVTVKYQGDEIEIGPFSNFDLANEVAKDAMKEINQSETSTLKKLKVKLTGLNIN